MKNFVQPGEVITLTAPYNVLSGGGLKVGLIVGIAAYNALSGEKVETKLTGVFDHPKAPSQAWTEGAAVYWDDAAKLFTTTASGNTKAGVAVLAVAGGANDTTGRVRLNGSF